MQKQELNILEELMFTEMFTKVQDRLDGLSFIKYVGEDWGQLEYSERPPVNFPCTLFDIGEVDYTDATGGVQMAKGTITIRIADHHMRNTSSRATDSKKVFSMYKILSAVYKSLQGMQGERFTKLTRVKTIKVMREDGIREFVMIFRFSGTDYDACKQTKPARPDMVLTTKTSKKVS